jgi:hypothetical protein
VQQIMVKSRAQSHATKAVFGLSATAQKMHPGAMKTAASAPYRFANSHVPVNPPQGWGAT